MKVRTRKNSRSTVVRISGAVSRAEMPRLCRALKKAIPSTETRVVVDVRDLEDVELAFVQVAVSASLTAAAGNRELCFRDGVKGSFTAMIYALGLEKDIALWGDDSDDREEGVSIG